MNYDLQNEVKKVTAEILADYETGRDIDKMEAFAQPDHDAVIDIVNKLVTVFFPGYYREDAYKSYSYRARLSILIEDVIYNLGKQIAKVLPYADAYKQELLDAGIIEISGGTPESARGGAAECNSDAFAIDAAPEEILVRDDARLRERSERIALEFARKIPAIRALVDTDMEAILDGDPAAVNKAEIVLCYPGLLATCINRIAHELYLLKIPMIPRIMTEHAHSMTGIDIHPGATIGEYFMIDHGTGIVIGETSEIGHHVKIYQGVTIGALSTSGGRALHGSKRHPTIRDNVTIYAGATILGGETVIGKGSVIGATVFITRSIGEDTVVSNKSRELSIHRGTGAAPKNTPNEIEPREDEEPTEGNWYI